MELEVIQTLIHAVCSDFQISGFTPSSARDALLAPAQIDAQRLLLELARSNARTAAIAADGPFVLRNISGLSSLPWNPQELTILDELRQPRTFQELAASTGIAQDELEKILRTLDSLHCLDNHPDSGHNGNGTQAGGRFPFESLIREIRSEGFSEKLEIHRNPSSFISEQFKTLKVKIREQLGQRASEVIAISSPCPEEGKSLVSINLAFSLSKDPGRKVVIIDCDMRNPSLHELLGVPSEPGLLGYLESTIHKPHGFLRRAETLYFLAAGGIARNPIELLTNERMKNLLEYLKADFDTIVIDSPPFSPVSDAQVLTSLCDGFVLVVRCGKTPYGSLERTYRSMDRGKLIGTVLNDVKPMIFNTEHNYRYYHPRVKDHYPYAK